MNSFYYKVLCLLRVRLEDWVVVEVELEAFDFDEDVLEDKHGEDSVRFSFLDGCWNQSPGYNSLLSPRLTSNLDSVGLHGSSRTSQPRVTVLYSGWADIGLISFKIWLHRARILSHCTPPNSVERKESQMINLSVKSWCCLAYARTKEITYLGCNKYFLPTSVCSKSSSM